MPGYEAITESVVSVSVTLTSSSNGEVKGAVKRLKKNAAIRNVSISSEEHNPERLITVKAGKHTLVEQLEDLQAYSTSEQTDIDKANKIGQNDEIYISVYVPSGAAPATNKKYVAAIAYWEIEKVA